MRHKAMVASYLTRNYDQVSWQQVHLSHASAAAKRSKHGALSWCQGLRLLTISIADRAAVLCCLHKPFEVFQLCYAATIVEGMFQA